MKEVEFVDGKRSYCKLFMNIHYTKFKGNIVNGILNGEGQRINKKGDIYYQGEFKNNKFEGKGLLL